MAREGRSIWGTVFKNFVNSLRPKRTKGNFMGLDRFGNKYYEIPADPQGGKRRPSRWFEPIGGDSNFDQEMPAEWEAWLRGRRIVPPTEEELGRNLAMMHQKKEKAAELSQKFTSKKQPSFVEQKGMESFPKYKDFEMFPGKKPD